ncbi:MAG: SIMPL domain-containing protein [Defluviitaleaceae bacterium]|nr:SIMPL domain-containing protein [Defluviitaleaceae bacterium]
MNEQQNEKLSASKQGVSVTKAIIIGGCFVIATAIFALGLVASANIAVNGFVEYRSIAAGGGISATGSASKVFKSNLATWDGSFSVQGQTVQEAFETIRNQTEIIRTFLLDAGITEAELTFLSVDFFPLMRYEYNNEGRIIAEHRDGYNLTQRIHVSSENVDKIEEVSRKISELIYFGVMFHSHQPQYLYTGLDELRLEMIEEATKNAKSRIDLIAANSDSRVGKLMNATLGVFQITGYPSAQEFTASGFFDTSSIWKTASVTVRLFYAIDG